ncbi:MAG: two-component system sensor histidine kinase NtrB [Myxococcales bacterium]
MPDRVKSIALASEITISTQFLAGIIDETAHPIFVKDRQYRFVVINQAFCDLMCAPRDEILGKTDYDFFPREEADWFRKKDADMFATGESQVIDGESFTDQEGKHHVLATTKAPLRNAAGEIEYLVGIIKDISQIKAAEDELRRTNEELERRVRERTAALRDAQHELMRKERLAVLGQLAGGIAHQIRNPLAIISNSAYLLQRLAASRPDPDLEAPVAMILEEVWKANRTITGLLDYARFRPPQPQPVSLQEIVARALGSLSVPENITVRSELSEVPQVAADPEQVREAITNLVQNAIEAMPDGGALSFEATREGRCVSLRIRDSGPGISAEQQRHLFQPLVTTKANGLGLGLTTARMLIENQQGSIEFENEPCAGAVFKICLPVHAQLTGSASFAQPAGPVEPVAAGS